MKVTDSDRLSKIMKSYVVLFMVLTFAFGAFLGIDRLKTKIIKKNPEGAALGVIMTILTTVVILGINTGLAIIVKKLTIS